MSATTEHISDRGPFGWGFDRHGAIDLDRSWSHPLSYGHKPPGRGAVSDRVSLLTAAQRDCLRLVYDHMTSKDIARALGISPHTVDMRLRNAMKTLGVASRIEAARALVDSEGGADAYQPLIYQAPPVAEADAVGTVGVPASTASDEYATQHSDTRFSPAFGPPASGPPRLAGASLPDTGSPTVAGEHRERSVETPLAGSLPWGARNTLSPSARLAWVAMIAIGSSLGFGAILGALEALKKLL